MGRSRGRQQQRRRYEKAIHPGALATMAGANGTAQPRGMALADAVNALTSRAMYEAGTFGAVPMPRDPRDQVAFGPSWPLPPQPLDPARPDTKRPEPRVSEYPVSWNLPGSGNKLVPWQVLYAASENVDILRRCIEIRKKHVRGMEWAWVVDPDIVASAYRADARKGRDDVEAELRDKYLPEIQRATEFWRMPWKSNGLSFGQWVNGWIDQHLTLDAVAIYPQMTYGGKLLALELIDGATIKPLLDFRGSRPVPPFPAFQQNVYGFPRGEFTATTETTEDGLTVVNGAFLADQLYYHRENFRPQTPYGYSATEQALISARLYLKRQGWMLAEYEDGSTPVMWLTMEGTPAMMSGASAMTATQRREWEDSLNDEYGGQTRARHRVKVPPPGMKPMAMPAVDERYKPEYDLFLIKMLASHYGVTNTELGFSESTGLGNSGLHEGQERTGQRVGTDPDLKMLAESINDLSRTFLKTPPEIVFQWIDKAGEDSQAEDATADAQRKRATITINDDRKRLGLAARDEPEADMLLFINGNQVVPLEGLAERIAQQDAQAQQLADAKSGIAGAAPMGMDGTEDDVPPEDMEAAKAAEISAYHRWVRRNPDPRRPFLCKYAEPSDFDDADPDLIAFEGWEYTEDLTKAYESWWPRDSRGRWIRRVHLGHMPEGPEHPGKEVLEGLKRHGRANGSSSTIRGMDTPTLNTRQLGHLKSGLHSPEGILAGNGPTEAALARRGLVEPYGHNMYRLTDAGRAHLDSVSGVSADRIDAPVQPDATQRRTLAEIHAEAEHVNAEIARMNDSYQARNDAWRSRMGELRDRADELDAERRAASIAEGRAKDAAARAAAAERVDQPLTHPELGERIKETVRAHPDEFMSLADLRDSLGADHDRVRVDLTLTEMSTHKDTNIVPVANLKSLTPREREAALMLGNGPRHVIRVTGPASGTAEHAARNPVSPDAPTDMRNMKTSLGPGEYKSPEQIKTDAAAYREREQAKIDELEATRAQYIAAGRKKTREPLNPIKIIDDDIARRKSNMEDAERRVTPFGQSGIVPPTPEQEAGMAAERAETERTTRLRGLIANAETVHGTDRSQWRPATRRQVEAMEANLAGLDKTPAKPTPAPAPVSAMTPVYDKLLDGGLVKHKQSRQIVEQMEAHGWELTGQNPMYATTSWRAPDGRTLHAQFLTEDRPKFYVQGVGRGALTYRDALAHVVTPTHEEVGGPNIRAAAEQVSPGLGERVSDRLINGRGDASLDPLVKATRQLSGYGGTQRRTHTEVAESLRAEAASLETLAESNAAHAARFNFTDDSKMASGQRERAAQFRQIADTLERQAGERQAYEAERERRAGLPLDIRPTTRGASASAKPAKPTAAHTGGSQSLASREAALSDAVASGVASEHGLSGGEAADVKLITTSSGARVILKKTKEDMGNWSPKDQTDAEELASAVAEAVGVRAPAMRRVRSDTAYQEFIPGASAKQLYGKGVPDHILNSDDGIRLGLLDRITNNTDRHAGNWLVADSGGIAAIDNGMAFNYSTTIGHNPFGKAHFGEDTPNALTPADAAEMRARLEALKPRFTAMGRTKWYRAMMAQFDDVERNANGTRDIYGAGSGR